MLEIAFFYSEFWRHQDQPDLYPDYCVFILEAAKVSTILLRLHKQKNDLTKWSILLIHLIQIFLDDDMIHGRDISIKLGTISNIHFLSCPASIPPNYDIIILAMPCHKKSQYLDILEYHICFKVCKSEQGLTQHYYIHHSSTRSSVLRLSKSLQNNICDI